MRANCVHSCDRMNFPGTGIYAEALLTVCYVRELLRSSGNQDVNGWTDGWVSLEIEVYVPKCVYVYTYMNRGEIVGIRFRVWNISLQREIRETEVGARPCCARTYWSILVCTRCAH